MPFPRPRKPARKPPSDTGDGVPDTRPMGDVRDTVPGDSDDTLPTMRPPTSADEETVDARLAPPDATIADADRHRPAENALNVLRGGKFHINFKQVIGEGGSAVVRTARDLSLRRDLAIKQLRNPGDDRARVRFIDEAQITSQLQHPNIIPVHELALDDSGAPFIAMKHVHGQSLRDVIIELHAEGGPHGAPDAASNERRLLEIFLKVCDAMAYAHSRRVIHRDLKPLNIMVGEFGEVLVMDWGLARPFSPLEAQMKFSAHPVTSDRRLAGIDQTSHDGGAIGTLSYMSPEQAAGQTNLDARTDIYSLGAILYAMLTGYAPFTGKIRSRFASACCAATSGRPANARRTASCRSSWRP
ncbi:MAG: serine/threonine-protein kinase [Planctomycetota bacterium]